jgi:hypothetical protein
MLYCNGMVGSLEPVPLDRWILCTYFQPEILRNLKVVFLNSVEKAEKAKSHCCIETLR